jgi:hypothetical protein
MDEFKEKLSEVRTCSSILGLACARMFKNIKPTPDLIRYITILNETLNRLEGHIDTLEAMAKGDGRNGVSDNKAR